MENRGQYALITGATSGIGYELARLFAKDKYNLILVARSADDLQRVSRELQSENIEVHTLAKDLFLKESAAGIYEEVKSKGIAVSVLVNDAGQGHYGKFLETDLEQEMKIVQLNILSCISLTKLFAKDMVARKAGKILNVGSIAGEAPGPYHSVYHGTKAFVNSWSAAIQNELEESGVSVTVLLPGPTDTDFFNKADMQDSKIVDTKLADPAGVARDGYDALMNGDAKITSGMMNKAQVLMGNVLPDSTAAESMRKQQEPRDTK
jgi:short-subunit dehydrogenase